MVSFCRHPARGAWPSAGRLGAGASRARRRHPRAANRAVYLDKQGVVRWSDDRQEVTLFGANYVLPTASDYRAAGYLHADRKRMIDEDMAQFARMGWDGMRLTFWGDWEASDSAGNLIANDHLDLQDYLIARARERGIYMLFSPIQLYGSNWPDALGDTTAPGFGRHFGKERMGTDPAAIAAQVNYLRQILRAREPLHRRRAQGRAGDPLHRAGERAGASSRGPRGLGPLHQRAHRRGAPHRVPQARLLQREPGFPDRRGDPAVAGAGRDVRLVSHRAQLRPRAGRQLPPRGRRLPRHAAPGARPAAAHRVRVRQPRPAHGTMYPAMARTFRAVGAQFAAMFAYDMLRTASRNLGWQTHYLNLVYTPRKAMSAIIAAEAMRRLPRMRSYGPYPRNTRFGDFHVSLRREPGELVARDAFLYAGSTRSTPPDPAALRRIAGYGSSPIVAYEGEGIYFLDKVRPGVWRLEVYPDAVPVRDPFEPPSPDKIVTRAIHRAWPMTVALPDLGRTFTVQPVTAGNPRTERAADGRFTVTPGCLRAERDRAGRCRHAAGDLGHVGFAEYHAPPPDSLPPSVTPLAAPAILAGRDAELRARVVDANPARLGGAVHPAGGRRILPRVTRCDPRGPTSTPPPSRERPCGRDPTSS